MKKPSFFERLAGNLRFDDTEEELAVRDLKKDHGRSTEKKELPQEEEISIQKEEVGELPVDVYETPHEIIIQTLIAGVLPEHLTIDITRDIVRISGKREESKGIPNDAYHIRELYWGAFERTVTLPEEVEIDAAEAIERHGMLMIKLPKIDKKRRSVLKIKSI